MTGSIYEKVIEILGDKDIDDLLPLVIEEYCKRIGKSTVVVNMALTAMNTAINIKDNELKNWYQCVSSLPKKSKLSERDKNVWSVFSYCRAYLNFPKFYEDSIVDPIHKRFIGISYFKNDKYSMEMWRLFKELIIPMYIESPDDPWFITSDDIIPYVKWCIKFMDLIEKE